MCNAASFIITRENIYFSKTSDSHSKILEEYGIKDNSNHVAVEITPPGNNYCKPLKEWVFRVDSNFPLPDWWNAAWGEEITRQELKKWAKYHIFKNKNGLKFSGDMSVVLINCKNIEITGQTGGYCRFYDNSKIVK